VTMAAASSAVSLALGLALALATCVRDTGGARRGSGSPSFPDDDIEDPIAESAPIRLPPDVRPTRYALSLRIVPGDDRFTGRVRIDLELGARTDRIALHAEGLDVRRVRVLGAAGHAVSATWHGGGRGGRAIVLLAAPIGPGRATLELAWAGAFATDGKGAYTTEDDGLPYALTFFEPAYARRAFPCFDEPAFKARFDITLTIPARHAAVSNEPIARTETIDAEMKRVHFATTEPLPTYLVAWSVGPFDVLTAAPIAPGSARRGPLPLRGVAPHGRGAMLSHALSEARILVPALERYFGSAFPFRKLDLVAAPGLEPLGMEHAGAISIQAPALLVDRATTSRSRRDLAIVLAHEIVHMWIGDLVTIPWWSDLWVQEGLTTWIAYKTAATALPRYRVEEVLYDYARGVMRDDMAGRSGPLQQEVPTEADYERVRGHVSYAKGATVLATFERWIGEAAFRRGVRLHVERHRFATGGTADLLSALSEASGSDVATALRTFAEQRGAPHVAAEIVCERGASARRSVRLQSDALWRVPVCVVYPRGAATAEACTLLESSRAELPLDADACPAWVMPNAAAFGYYVWSLPPAQATSLRRNGARLTRVQRRAVEAQLGTPR